MNAMAVDSQENDWKVDLKLSLLLNKMEEEIERQLDAKAAKENLTATNVKVLLKNIITNDGVLAMLKNSLHDSNEGAVFEPKLTRAKAKYVYNYVFFLLI